LFFSLVSLSITAYFMAIGRTRVVFYSAVFTAIANVILDYLLIFGNYGLPEMGLAGASLASTLSDGLGMCVLFYFLYKNPTRKKHRLFEQLRINKKSILELIKVGSPILLQGIVALSTWTIFFTWIEQLGKHELTISQNIRSIYFLAFVPLFGFAATTKTYVSQYVGSKNYDAIKIIQRKVQILTLVFLFVFFHGALFYPEYLVSIINPDKLYLGESSSVLRYVAGSILMYGIFSVYFQTINGTGNTRATLYIEIISVAIYLTSAYLLIKVYEVGIVWIWSVEYIYFGVMGLLSIGYLKLFNWKSKRI
jgi:multidrug resistance protein, MATE family